MPREKRDDFVGACHHVMNRGVRQGAIFYSEQHCIRFLELVEEAVERFGIRVYAYVLMSNHYHLQVESVRGNLSAAMRMISQEYTQYVNKLSGFDGPVFRGRFKNKLVMNDAHWHYLPVYMHLNPVKARMVSHAGQYLWSSYSSFAGETVAPGWLSVSEMQEGYGGAKGYLELHRDVVEGREAEPDEFESILFENRGAQKIKLPKVAKHKPFRTPTAALREISDLTGVSVAHLKQTGRGRVGNAPRALALWWLVFGAELGPTEAARKLNMTPNAASKILSKFRLEGTSYKSTELWDWKQQLEEKRAIGGV